MKVTEETLALFEEFHVFFSKDGRRRLKVGDKIIVSSETSIEPYCTFFVGGNIFTSGSFSYSWSNLPANLVKVGRYCSIADNVCIMGRQHPYTRFANSALTYQSSFSCFNSLIDKETVDSFKPVQAPDRKCCVIGNDVWIGGGAKLKDGISIGDGAIIGANALVTHDVMPYEIVGGVPAKRIKSRFPESIIHKMVELKWWEYNFADFYGFSGDMPVELFIDKLSQRVADGKIKKWNLKVLTADVITKTCSS